MLLGRRHWLTLLGKSKNIENLLFKIDVLFHTPLKKGGSEGQKALVGYSNVKMIIANGP